MGTTGLLLGLVAGLPVVALVHSSIDYPLVSAFAWVLCAAGVRIGVAKGQEIVRAAGMSHLLDRPAEPPPGTALLVDSSAVMDRYLMVLGRSGLLAGGVVRAPLRGRRGPGPGAQPRPRGVAARPPGLEAIEALQAGGVQVWMNEDEVPELDDTGDRALALAHRLHVRLGTCSADLAERAEAAGGRRRRPPPPGRRVLARPPSGRAPGHRPREGGPPTSTGRRVPARGRHGGRQRRVASRGAAATSRSSSPRPARRARASWSSPSSSRAARRWRTRPARGLSQAALTAATSFDSESLASPKSMVVLGS